MKTNLLLQYVFALLFVFTITAKAQNKSPKLNKESLDSFYKAIDDITWESITEDNSRFPEVRRKCKADLIQKIKKFKSKKFKKNNAYLTATKHINELADMVEKAAKDYEFKSAYENEFKFLDNWKRYKIYKILGESNLPEEFIKNFESNTNNEKLTTAEKKALEVLYLKHVRYVRTTYQFYEEKYQIDNCSFTVRALITLLSITETKIEWTLSFSMDSFDCKCSKGGNPLEVNFSQLGLQADMSSTVKNNDFQNMIFSSVTNKRYWMIGIKCCDGEKWDYQYDGKEEYKTEETPKDDKDNSKEEEKEEEKKTEDKEDKKETDKKDEDCCTTEQPNQTIGFLPGVALTDNFENVSYDLGIEYLRYIGDSFADNRLYAGALVGYMGENSQDGEVKENMIYGAGIIENRTPISDCGDVQWVNRVCVQYGQGTIDAFGNKDDFSTLTFGIHTGFNFQLNDNVAIGADVAVVNFGSVTFKPDNGPEIKQDIGDVNLNKRNRVRFGVRFRF